MNLLNAIEVDYITQYSSKDATWCENYRYDFKNEDDEQIIIGKRRKWYCKKDEHTSYLPIDLREHKLLHELFEIWGWFNEKDSK